MIAAIRRSTKGHDLVWSTSLALLLLMPGCGPDATTPTNVDTIAEKPVTDALSTDDSQSEQPTPRRESILTTPDTRYLIIHADDAGMCRSVNRGTFDALEAGIVTSASIMVPCPAFEHFAEYARTHPKYDYGIHLTLNAEFRRYRWGPVLPHSEVPSLVDGSGYLWRTQHEVAGHARADDVERELRAQIDRAQEVGIPLSHLDTHMGTLFMRPDLLEIYVRLGVDYNLPVLLPRNDSFLKQLGVDERVSEHMDSIILTLQEHGFPILDDVRMHYERDSVSSKKRAYRKMIRTVPPGVTELIIHCGEAGGELQSITLSHGIRSGDREVFTDPAMIEEIRNANVKLINWQQLHQLSSDELPRNGL